ncbi:MAG: FAD-binding protein [Deltaproteobacteria bacterium]|nr:FAD-binding protein [Deltaproteobacteria bacterium]
MTTPNDPHWHSQVGEPIIIEDVEAAQWDESTDLVVVGFGGAGAATALEARQRGADVLVLDHFHGGGATAMSGGIYYAGGGTQQQKEAGCDDAPEDMFGYLSREVQGAVSDETLRAFCDQSIETLHWLEKFGLEFRGTLSPVKTSYPYKDLFLYYSGNEALPVNAEHAKPAPRGHRHVAKGQGGLELFNHLKAACQREGVRTQLQSEVRRLIVDPQGEVVGVEALRMTPGTWQAQLHARTADLLIGMRSLGLSLFPAVRPLMRRLEATARQRVRIRGRRGVVLAAGGFVQNRGMLKAYLPRYTRGLPNGSLGCDGSGIRLGESVGGATSHMDHASAWRFVNPPLAFAEGIIVNRDGERICNESAYGAQIGHAMCEENDGHAWLVLDRALFDAAVEQCRKTKMWRFQSLPALLTLYAGAKKGETLEELARSCGMPPKTLCESVEAYNTAARGEREDPFRKASDFMAELGQGPWRALDISLGSKTLPCAIITFGGLAVHESTSQVLREGGSVIPGLYAVGRSAAGIPSNNYVSGLAIADCVFTGRRAARAALAGASY